MSFEIGSAHVKVTVDRAQAIGGLAAITSAAGVAGAALAALPALGASVAGIGGVLAASFSGVGDALKGYQTDQKAATKVGGQSAAAAGAQARQIRDAQQAIDAARRNSAKVAKESAERVADAQANEAKVAREVADQVNDAREDQRRVAEDVADAIEDAQQSQAKTARQGAEAQEKASQKVADALEDERDAQDDLTKARADAAEQLDDLREKVSDYALTEEDAAIRVERAREDLLETEADSEASALDLREARNDLAQAEERLKDIQEDRAKSTAELAKQEALGANGSEKVVDAQEKVADAQDKVAEAQREASRTAVEVAEANSAAAEKVAEAVSDGARKQQDAAEKVADAVADGAERQQEAAKATAKAQQDGAEAQQAAAEAVAEAVEGLNDAQASAAESASSAAVATSAYADAMAKLNPEQKKLVEQLLAMKPLVDGLKNTASTAFLPGLTQMLQDSAGLFPIFEEHLQRTGAIMGETAIKLGTLFKNDEFKTNLDALFKSSEPITRAIGDGLVSTTEKLVEFGAKMAPAALGFAQFTKDVLTGFQGMLTSLEPYAADFQSIWESVGRISAVVLPAVGEAIGQIASTLAPILDSVAGFLERNKDSLDDWMLTLVGLFAALKGAQVVAGVAQWTTGVVGKVAEMGSKIGLTGGQVGLALAGITAAVTAGIWIWDQLRSKADESAKAIAAGSMSFQQSVDEELKRLQARQMAYDGMQGEGYAAGQAIGELTGKIDVQAQKLAQEAEAARLAEQGWQDYLATLTPVEAAKAKVTRAESDYQQALKDFGPVSAEAKAAQERLSSAVNDEELAQSAAELATKDHTDALKEQQDQILGSMSADLAHRQALHDLKAAQDAAAAAARNHGAGSDESTEASFRLEAAELRVIDTAQRLAVETSGATTESQKNKAAADAQMGAMLNLAASMGNDASPAVQQYARDLRQADLDAHNATVRTSGFGFEVKRLPDGREVLIQTPGLEQARAGIRGLQQDILNVNGKTVSIFVTATGQGGLASAGRLATGGIVPGYTPGRDIAPYMLSGGEAVMRPEWTRAVGAGWIDGANKAARAGGVKGAQQYMTDMPGFADGGIVAKFNYARQGASPQALVDGFNTRAIQLGQAAYVPPAPTGGGSAPASRAGNVAAVQSVANGYGWGAGPQWDALYRLIMKESGFNNLAQNPTSTAFGMFQFLNGTWPGYGVKTSDPRGQAIAGLKYVAQRYGTPANALAFHNKNNWYDDGGVLPSGMAGFNGSGKPERVLSPEQTAAFEKAMNGGFGGGGDTYNVNVTIPARDLEEMRNVQAFFDRVQQVARSSKAGRVATV